MPIYLGRSYGKERTKVLYVAVSTVLVVSVRVNEPTPSSTDGNQSLGSNGSIIVVSESEGEVDFAFLPIDALLYAYV